jgi:CheY-like chemotaxis protein
MATIDINFFKHFRESITILYVEDNTALREKAGELLQKVFTKVFVASDGIKALEILKKVSPDIVITDIKMPNMDGTELAQQIHQSYPHIKIIILSAYDSKENLFKSIKLGVFRFITKPVNIEELFGTLKEALEEIQKEQDKEIFITQLQDVFNYQGSIVLLLKKDKIKIASQKFLDFFAVKDVAEFEQKYEDLGTQFIKHEGFLYNTNQSSWLEQMQHYPEKFFHIKIKDKNQKLHHLLAKLRNVPNKKDYTIVSFDDITELSLLEFFDEKLQNDANSQKEQQAIFDLFSVLKRNNATVKMYNYYKGLSIVHEATVVDIGEKNITLKSPITQQRAALYEQKTIISSEALPYPVLCKHIVANDFTNQQIVFEEFTFLHTSPLQRKYVRLEPDENYKISLFIDGEKVASRLNICDISMEGICIYAEEKIHIEENGSCNLVIVFQIEKQKLTISAVATIYKSGKKQQKYEYIFLLTLDNEAKKTLSDYLVKRQMQLIREFKGLEDAQ